MRLKSYEHLHWKSACPATRNGHLVKASTLLQRGARLDAHCTECDARLWGWRTITEEPEIGDP